MAEEGIIRSGWTKRGKKQCVESGRKHAGASSIENGSESEARRAIRTIVQILESIGRNWRTVAARKKKEIVHVPPHLLTQRLSSMQGSMPTFVPRFGVDRPPWRQCRELDQRASRDYSLSILLSIKPHRNQDRNTFWRNR